MKTIIFAFLLAACSSCDARPVPPKLPPADGDGTCETAHANLTQLGGCGLSLDQYVPNCHDAEKEEATRGVRHPNTCVTNAPDCPAVFRCK